MMESEEHEPHSADHRASRSCPSCGIDIDEEADSPLQAAQRKISELEGENRMLTEKATAAVDKLADYEDEIRQLRCSQNHSSTNSEQHVSSPAIPPSMKRQVSFTDETKPLPAPPPEPLDPDPVEKRPTTMNRFSSFLSRSKSVSAKSPREPTPPNSSGNDGTAPSTPVSGLNSTNGREAHLASLLSQERTLRAEAEEKVKQVNNEIEELSATLFQQANEMVATERKARAKLEERAAKQDERARILEEKVKVLERRDAEKRKRLERLEVALSRIDRVRGMLDGK